MLHGSMSKHPTGMENYDLIKPFIVEALNK
jgi:hypothetical protein